MGFVQPCIHSWSNRTFFDVVFTSCDFYCTALPILGGSLHVAYITDTLWLRLLANLHMETAHPWLGCFLGSSWILWFGPAGSISAWSSAVALFHAMRRFQVQPDDVSCLEPLAVESWEFLIATHGQWGPNDKLQRPDTTSPQKVAKEGKSPDFRKMKVGEIL